MMAQQQPPRGAAPGGNRENVLKTLAKKQKDDVRSMLDNFSEILKLAKVSWHSCLAYPCPKCLLLQVDEERTTPVKVQTVEQEQLEMAVRASNLVSTRFPVCIQYFPEPNRYHNSSVSLFWGALIFRTECYIIFARCTFNLVCQVSLQKLQREDLNCITEGVADNDPKWAAVVIISAWLLSKAWISWRTEL